MRIPTANEMTNIRPTGLGAPRLAAPVAQRDQFADALAEIGKIGGKTAIAYVDREEQLRKQGEDLQVQTAVYDANTWLNDKLTEAKTLQGVNAVGVRDKFMADIGTEFDKRSGQFADPRMALAFKEGLTRIKAGADTSLSEHEKVQRFQAQKDTLSTGIKAETENALRALADGDEYFSGVAVLAGMDKKRELARLSGLDEEGQSQAAFDWRSGILAAHIDNQTVSNPTRARTLYEGAVKGGLLNFKDRDALDAKTKATSESAEGIAAGQAAFDSMTGANASDYDKAYASLVKTYQNQPTKMKAAADTLQTLYTNRVRANEHEVQAKGRELWEMIQTGTQGYEEKRQTILSAQADMSKRDPEKARAYGDMLLKELNTTTGRKEGVVTTYDALELQLRDDSVEWTPGLQKQAADAAADLYAKGYKGEGDILLAQANAKKTHYEARKDKKTADQREAEKAAAEAKKVAAEGSWLDAKYELRKEIDLAAQGKRGEVTDQEIWNKFAAPGVPGFRSVMDDVMKYKAEGGFAGGIRQADVDVYFNDYLKSKKTGDKIKNSEIRDRFMEAVVSRLRPGESPTPTRVREIAADVARSFKTPGEVKSGHWYQVDPDMTLGEALATGKAETWEPDSIPDQERAEIEAALKSRNLPTDPATVMRAWRLKNGIR